MTIGATVQTKATTSCMVAMVFELNDASLDIFQISARGFHARGALRHLVSMVMLLAFPEGLRIPGARSRTPLVTKGPVTEALDTRLPVRMAGAGGSEVAHITGRGRRGVLLAVVNASVVPRRGLGGGLLYIYIEREGETRTQMDT